MYEYMYEYVLIIKDPVELFLSCYFIFIFLKRELLSSHLTQI